MKARFLIILTIAALFTGACSFTGMTGSRTLRGSGDVASETREVSGFNRIRIDGVGELHLVQGERESLRIEAEDNILERIETRTDAGKLIIGYERGFRRWSIVPTEPVRFYLTVIDLDEITINGGVRILNEEWNGDELTLTINGAADIDMQQVNLNSLELRLQGGADCSISGEAETLEIRVDGAGSVDLDEFESADARVVVNGLSDIRLWVTESLDVEINGAGQVNYYGSAEVTSAIEGLGSVHKLGEK